MPPAIRKIATQHLRDPETIAIETPTITVATVDQRYLNVTERQKLDALTRVLEVEAPEAALVFVRPRTAPPSSRNACRRAATPPKPCTAT